MGPDESSRAGEKFQRLVDIMARLRSPDGCPWDREQTFESIKAYTLEETYEVLDAIDSGDKAALAEELGDFMLQAVFLARIAEERGEFRIDDSLDAIVSKLIRRHPHVFADGDAKTAEDVKRRWDEIKREEKREAKQAESGLLDDVPRATPALVEAQQLTSRASTVGFDWEKADQVLAKLDEEMKELAESRRRGIQEEIEAEVGDVLFVLVNLARLLKVDAEQALRGTNAKFRGRFGYIERKLASRGRDLAGATLDEMDELWNEAKKRPE
ncbi:MAG: nucleoside triphosphate pyrophosphohydrolase [Bryobacteraceae bacterium]